MRAARQKHPAEFNHSASIQPKPFNGRAASGALGDHELEIHAPGEVVIPLVLPGIVQRHKVAGDRINCFDGGVLAVVAFLARERQVLGLIPANGPGHDMLDGEPGG